eukprot:1211005-Prymnesium_polylepis.1
MLVGGRKPKGMGTRPHRMRCGRMRSRTCRAAAHAMRRRVRGRTAPRLTASTPSPHVAAAHARTQRSARS